MYAVKVIQELHPHLLADHLLFLFLSEYLIDIKQNKQSFINLI
ncbi:hypothetical protein Mpsy_0925 [Methanolobus psychrophilus R15]|nr:hypothetical protein Mpsy_0925 [Methanolobus psychrophilus R15]